jgi:riboflavin kinase/FMN adenylyltransferase
LTSVDEKVALLRSAGLDTVALVRFTNKIAAVGAESFVETLAQTVRLRGMVVGESHAFGSGRKGNPALLVELGRRFGFWTEVVPPVRMDGETVSSTRIRTLLAEGAVEKANRFLGRHYRVEGRVVEGKKLGSRLGFPTANLVPEPADKCVPGNGVYAVFVRIGGDSAIGSANIGTAPTTGKKPRGLEVHVHGWSGELYGNRVAVEFVRRLRDERAFPSLDALADQIQKDKEESRKWLS